MKNKFTSCLVAAAVACAAGVQWTRFTGTVKAINLKTASVTLQLKGGDLVTVPVDYQVKIKEKGDIFRELKDLQLDDKVTLTLVPSEQSKEESFGEMNQDGKSK